MGALMANNILHQQDKEYLLLTEIEANQEISQRELSQKAGLSLGSVNLLLKKMARQGLIKMESIPANRIIYMLTPAGLAEKAFKTMRYIKVHYKVIEETKQRIIDSLSKLHQEYETIYIIQPEDELQDILQQAIHEYIHTNPGSRIIEVESAQEVNDTIYDQTEKAALLALPDDLVLDRVRIEYRKYLTAISMLELF
jgi:DNA-binding MarR family transcriptional regulator